MSNKFDIKILDISSQTFGKYQHCTMHNGMYYADSDFELGCRKPKAGALPSPIQSTKKLTLKAQKIHENAANKAIADKFMSFRKPKPTLLDRFKGYFLWG